MFEGIKIVTTFKCVRGSVSKNYWSYKIDILIPENYLLLQNYSL